MQHYVADLARSVRSLTLAAWTAAIVYAGSTVVSGGVYVYERQRAAEAIRRIERAGEQAREKMESIGVRSFRD